MKVHGIALSDLVLLFRAYMTLSPASSFWLVLKRRFGRAVFDGLQRGAVYERILQDLLKHKLTREVRDEVKAALKGTINVVHERSLDNRIWRDLVVELGYGDPNTPAWMKDQEKEAPR